MRVLNTYTGQFVEIDPRAKPLERVNYAILSHTWDCEGKQTYQELREIQKRYHTSDNHDIFNGDYRDPLLYLRVLFQTPQTLEVAAYSIWTDPGLSDKIAEACRVARENGYNYLWIDSCCIDKTSSSELSESINSMYQWYARACVCYAFLPDVPAEEDHRKKESRFRRSRWFKRGWTLQELIAPSDVRFLSREWKFIGSKESLADLVITITRISYNALLHIEPLGEFSVAQRFSWAAERETTREEEDRAYSLLGIFNINMPTLYGEGEGAFRRLQEEIMRRTPDQSLFAWADSDFRLLDPSCLLYNPDIITSHGRNQNCSVMLTPFRREFAFLAQSLDDFKYCTEIIALSHAEVAHRLQLRPDQLSTTNYAFTPYGIRTQLPLISLSDFFLPGCETITNELDFPVSQWCLVILGCGHKRFPGHLLARVCCIKTSGSSLHESLQSGSTNINDHEFDLMPVSSATITRLHSSGKQVSTKTLYIPQPERDGAEHWGRGAFRRRHGTIKLVLQEKAYEALSTQGYTATLRSPDDSHPRTHSVILSHNTHTIIIDYQHTLGESDDDGQLLIMEAQVKVSGPVPHVIPGNSLRDSLADIVGSRISSEDFMPWEKDLDFKDIELNIPSGLMALTVRLGLTLAKVNYYLLRIELKTVNRRSSPSDHNNVTQAGRWENPADIHMITPLGVPMEGIPPGLMPGSWQDQWT